MKSCKKEGINHIQIVQPWMKKSNCENAISNESRYKSTSIVKSVSKISQIDQSNFYERTMKKKEFVEKRWVSNMFSPRSDNYMAETESSCHKWNCSITLEKEIKDEFIK